MKRIISIAMCAVMLAGAAQVSAQKKNQKKDKQGTEQASCCQGQGQNCCCQSPAQNDNRQGPGADGGRQQLSPEDMAKRRADRMKEQLSLSDDQYAKVLELNQDQAKQLAGTPRPSREEMQSMTDEQKVAMRDEFKKARDEYNAKLKGILTGEQYSKYEENFQGGMRGGHGAQGSQGAPRGGGAQGGQNGGQHGGPRSGSN